MTTDQKFEIIKALLAQGYKGSIAEVIQQKELEEVQALKAQEQAAQQGQNPNIPTPALAGKMPTQPQQSATERNIIQPGQYKSGGIKLNNRLGSDCKECGGFNKKGGVRKYGEGGMNEHVDLITSGGTGAWETHQQEAHHAGQNTGGDEGNTGYNYFDSSTWEDNVDPHKDPLEFGIGWGNVSGFSLKLGPSFGEFAKRAGKWGKGVWDKSSGWGKAGLMAGGIGLPFAAMGAGLDLKSLFNFKNGGIRKKGGLRPSQHPIIAHHDDGGAREYDNGGLKLSAGLEGNVSFGPGCGMSGCGPGESRFSLKPEWDMSYNTGTKNAGTSLGLGIQSIFGRNDTRDGAPFLTTGIRGEGLVNMNTLEQQNPETQTSLTGYGKLGYKQREDGKGFDVGAYGDYDLTKKRIKEAGIYGSYGGVQGNVGYSPSDKMIKAGLSFTLGKRKTGGARKYGVGGAAAGAMATKSAKQLILKQKKDEILTDTHSDMLPFSLDFFPELVTNPVDATYVYIPEIIIDEEATEEVSEEMLEELRLEQIQEENENIDEQTLSELKAIQVDHSQNREKNRKKKVIEKVKEETKSTMDAFYKQYNKVDYDETSSNQVKLIQQILVDEGYDIGAFGPNKDGIDGKFGNRTKAGYLDYMQKRLKTKNPITFSPESRDEECDENGCAQYVQAEFMREGYSVDFMDVGGDAWTMYDQIIGRGNGTSKFNIYDGEEFNTINSVREATTKSIKAYKNNLPDKGLFQIGDVVGLIYENSNYWGEAYKGTRGNHLYGDNIKNRTYNSHVGFVSGFDDNGNPIISHNVGGTVYNDTYDNIHGGGVAWIASPQTEAAHKYDYAENTTEHDNTDQLTFFDNKNYEGVFNISGSQHTYTKEEKATQNSAINFVKNNTPIILDELEITINGDDGETWLQEAVIGIAMHETGLGQNDKMPKKEEIRTQRALKNLVPFAKISTLDPIDFSLGITKTKLNSIGQGSKDYYGLTTTNINTDHNKVLAITIDNLSRNYALITGYAKDNPQLELTEQDIRNMTILSHNRGLLSKNPAGGGTGTNFGQRDDMTIDEQIASLRSLYKGNQQDISSTKYAHIPIDSLGKYLYNREYPDGAETYISTINRYIDRQILTHGDLEAKKKEDEKDVTMLNQEQQELYDSQNREEQAPIAAMGGYRSKNGW